MLAAAPPRDKEREGQQQRGAQTQAMGTREALRQEGQVPGAQGPDCERRGGKALRGQKPRAHACRPSHARPVARWSKARRTGRGACVTARGEQDEK